MDDEPLYGRRHPVTTTLSFLPRSTVICIDRLITSSSKSYLPTQPLKARVFEKNPGRKYFKRSVSLDSIRAGLDRMRPNI